MREPEEVTHTMATPAMTTSTDARTGRVNLRLSQKASTKHTNGMIISLEICAAAGVGVLFKFLLNKQTITFPRQEGMDGGLQWLLNLMSRDLLEEDL